MVSERQAQAQLDALAKPRGSLGRMEALARRLAVRQGTLAPRVRPRELVLFAGDHGVVASGVSAWPSDVTALMVRTIVAGRSVSAAWARLHDCPLRVVDVGVAACLDDLAADHFRAARVASGTDDLSCGPAMSVAAFDAAWEVGASEARAALARGCRVLLAGEMGIGNTTAAACLVSLLADVAPAAATGRGAGADEATFQAKRAVVAQAVRRAQPLLAGAPREAIAAVCGFEIAAMAGCFAEGARQGALLLLDGFVATAGALVAEHLQPGTAAALVAAHCSAEAGHGPALAALGLVPLLDWDMRLGEGTGALAALPLLDSAAALLCDVARLDELGVARGD